MSLTSALSHAAPTINTSPSSATPALGSTASLAASVTAEPSATYVWSRDGTTIINGGRYSGATTATLSISGANAADNGSYTLNVTDGTGTSATTPASITVTQTASSLDPAYNGAGAQGNNSAVYTNSVLHLPDGRTLLAVKNQFNGVTGTAISNLVVMSATGAVSHPGLTTPGTGGSFVGGSNGGDVVCIFRMGDGKILLGGDFTTHRTDAIVNTARNRVARLNADLTLDATFVATGPSASPSVIFADSYGRIYVGGTFNTYDSSTDYRNLVRLNTDGTLDTSFKPLINGGVTSVVLQKDGKFIVSGPFNSYSAFPSINAPGLIRFLADGTLDTSFVPVFPAGYATQTSLSIDASDNLYVGRSGATGTIFKLLPSGSLVSEFTAPSLAGQINTTLALPNGKVAICGFFSTPTSRFMVLNADGSQDTGFNVGTGLTATLSAQEEYRLSSDPLGRIWITGRPFNQYNGAAANRLAVLQGSGAASLLFTSQPGGRIANQGTTVSFTSAASGNNGFTYQWQKNGSPLSNGGNVSGATTDTLTLSNIQATDEAAYTVVVSSPGATSVTSRAASLDVLGVPEITQDPTAQTVDFGGSVILTGAAAGATLLTYRWYYGTTPLTNGTGVAGATTDTLILTNIDFNDAGQYSLKASNGLGDDTSAAVTLTVQKRPGGIAASANPLPMFNGEVHAIALLPDGSYVVGGGFDTVSMNGGLNFNSRSSLMRVLANGTLDTSFPTAAGAVHAVEVDSAGKIFIGGGFSSVTANSVQTNRVRVARLIASGASYVLDSAFDTSTAGPNQNVFAIAPVGDGSAFIGGDFTEVGSTTTGVNKMARLNANGTVNTAFVSGANNTVHKLWRRTDGSLYVAGLSHRWSVAEFAPRGVILVSATGARNAAFVPPGTGTSYFPGGHALLQLADGSLLAGLNWAGGNPYAVRMNGSTGALATFNSTHGTIVTALAQQSDGKLLIGGSFGYFTRNSATDGTVDTTMNIGTGFLGAFTTPKINAIKVDSNGRIFVVGNFTHYDGNTRNRFVILNGGDLDSRTTPKPGQTITFADIADRAFVPASTTANTVTITLPTSSSKLAVSLAVSSGPATLAGNKLTFTGAGSVVLTASQAGNDNFGAATVSQTIEISKAAQTLTFAALIDRPTGTAPFLLGAAASSGLPVSYQVLNGPATVNGNVLALTGATGVVSLRASQPGNADFTAAVDVDQSFDVFTGTAAKLPQTIVFNPLPPRSGSEGPTLTINASTTSGLPLTFTFTGPVTSIIGNTVTLNGATGTVAITAKQAGNANFLPAVDVKQSFAVTAPAAGITLTNLIQTYTGTPRAIGTVGGTGTPVISYTIGGVKGTTPPTNAGSYPVEAVIGTGVAAVKKTGSLVINKAPLIIAADDKRKFTGQDNPALSFAYSGFLGSDNAVNALTKAPTVATTATKTSPGGNYPITPVGGTSTNYAFVYVKGNMKVETFAGQYEALLIVEGSLAPTAKLEITVVATGLTYTGKLTTAKEATPVALAGTLPPPNYVDETLTFTEAFTRGTGGAAVTYNITFTTPLDGDFTTNVTRATGTPPGPAAPLGGTTEGKKLLLLSGTPPVEYAGAHTVIMGVPVPLAASALPLPAGSGYATAVIDTKGKMTFAGALPDGTKFTTSMLPDNEAGYRLYLQPYAARLDSYFGGWLPLSEHPDLSPRRY
ncbi:MAG: immunoglobulin domain-containing protein, partial [Prosthecobacter sp.]